jgi:hypothetical protein
MENQETYTSFYQQKRISHGTLQTMLLETKAFIEAQQDHNVLIFEDQTGKQIDFDFFGSPTEILARVIPIPNTGRGRPKLGVTSREVSLLPRHWEWLESQPSGASATLRRLIEQRAKSPSERERQITEAIGRFMTSMVGNAPNFEEASRALYSKDWTRFKTLITPWETDLQNYILERLSTLETGAV